jgi:pyridoxamine 5'-phosphate oxidase family protein
MTRHTLTPAEREFLARPRGLARIATVDSDGMPHVVPTGWKFDAEKGELLLTGRDVGNTQRVKHLAATPHAAVVIDGIDRSAGWKPWALMMRGHAHYDKAIDAVRLTPTAVVSWGI